MAKINKTGVEIIPISDSAPPPRIMAPRLPYISDPTIVPRVQKYLETNAEETVDLTVMADDLQRSHREYSRLKKNAFRAMVKKAFSIVLRNFGITDQDHEQDRSSSDDKEDSDEASDLPTYANPLNSQLHSLYTRPAAIRQIDENELIDISSDDSDDDSTTGGGGGGGGSGGGRPFDKRPSTSTSLHRLLALPNSTNNGSNNFDSGRRPLPQSHHDHYYNNSVNHGGGITNRRIPTPNTSNNNNNNNNSKKRKLEGHPQSQAAKKKKSAATLQEPNITFRDLGGVDKVLEDVCKLLVHLRHPEVYRQIGISPPRGFLLHGPPGCGKTLLANAIAGEIGIPLLKVAAPELVAGVSGESEERIRELFERALATTPCILFIDEIDAITPNRQNAQKDMERRIVAQLLSCLDDLGQNEMGDRVLVIGATNRPDAIDPALRRAGRFDREICLGIPDLKARVQILQVLTSNLKVSDGFDFDKLGRVTPGYVGADLLSLTREAAMAAVNRMFNTLKLGSQQQSQQSHQGQNEAANKSDPEIIVDDDFPPTLEKNDGRGDDGDCQKGDGDVVVIEDEKQGTGENSSNVVKDLVASLDTVQTSKSSTPSDLAGPPTILPETAPATTPTPNAPPTTSTANTTTPPTKTTPTTSTTSLGDLICWLHNQAPLSSDELSSLRVTMDDFASALKVVQPSAKREGFATVPDVTWDDVGSLKNVREELQMTILAPVRHAERFAELGLHSPTGVLLCGPPGCGKTLLAKAIANEAGINFISVKGPELLNMYVGESERAVRVCFERARNSAPCVIFFDELDAICPKRSDSRESGPTMRVVNQMLTEMDGVQERKGVFLLAATNRPDIIDPAVLRPGRLDKILYVGLPTSGDRADILKAITKNGTRPRLAVDVDLEAIGGSEQCRGYTGADLAALVKEAGTEALREYITGVEGGGVGGASVVVTTEHFNKAVAKLRPSVTDKDQKHYEKLRKIYAVVPDAEVEEMEYS